LRAPRIALFDTYGGGMPSGWTRMVLENFEFPYELVFPPDLDKGGLRAKYDVIVFNDAGAPAGGGGGGRGGGGAAAAEPPAGGGANAAGRAAGAGGGAGAAGQGRGGGQAASAAGAATAGQGRGGRAGFTPAPIPEEFAKRQGNVTAQTMAQIKQFVEEGGSVIAIGGVAMAYAQQFNIPVSNHLVENGQPLSRDKFYAPGCVLELAVDANNPLAHGIGSKVDVFFDNNPVFAMKPSASAAAAASAGQAPAGTDARAVAWFASPTPLRSGWAWGEKYFDKGTGMIESKVGKGHVFVFGPEILFRAQPHGTFKFFFNSLYLSSASEWPGK
jgi:hypothetical protein